LAKKETSFRACAVKDENLEAETVYQFCNWRFLGCGDYARRLGTSDIPAIANGPR
jgi:hypothetical protein